MKRISLDKVLLALRNLSPEVCLDQDIADLAKRPLEQMLHYAEIKFFSVTNIANIKSAFL